MSSTTSCAALDAALLSGMCRFGHGIGEAVCSDIFATIAVRKPSGLCSSRIISSDSLFPNGDCDAAILPLNEERGIARGPPSGQQGPVDPKRSRKSRQRSAGGLRGPKSRIRRANNGAFPWPFRSLEPISRAELGANRCSSRSPDDGRGPEEVERLRGRHVSRSCSVSYRNTGPLHIVGGRGSRLTDVNGVEYLDTRNNVAHCGHGHPEIKHAIAHQVERLNTNTRYLHPHASLLARKLSELLPGDLDVVFFVNSGSEANDLALRLARAHGMGRRGRSAADDGASRVEGKRQDYVITVDHAYHGHTLATLDVSPYKHRQGEEMKGCPDHVRRVPCPDLYRGIHSIGEFEGNELEAARKYASYVERECEEITSRGHSVRAFLVEGGMSVAGVILPPKSYLRRCAEAVRRAGGLYIADEVQTGFGRLGKCMWAFQYSDDPDDDGEGDRVVPDIVTVGKPFGNGMPLAAVVTTPAVASTFERLGVEYFNTFAGNPVCCAAGLGMLHVLSSERLRENAAEVGAYLDELFREVQSRSHWIGDVRGSGLFLGVELVRDRGTREPAAAETSFVCSMLKEKYRILTSIDGPHENVIVVKPPMVFSREDAAFFVSCFERALTEDLPLAEIADMEKTPT